MKKVINLFSFVFFLAAPELIFSCSKAAALEVNHVFNISGARARVSEKLKVCLGFGAFLDLEINCWNHSRV